MMQPRRQAQALEAALMAAVAVAVVAEIAETARPRLEPRVARLTLPAVCGWQFVPALSLAD
jgi:hypothetical protein